MVEGTTLERWHTRKGIEGSNPSLSVWVGKEKRKRKKKGVSGDKDKREREPTEIKSVSGNPTGIKQRKQELTSRYPH